MSGRRLGPPRTEAYCDLESRNVCVHGPDELLAGAAPPRRRETWELHAILTCMSASDVDVSPALASLRVVLNEQREALEQLVALAGGDDPRPAELIDRVDVLEGLDERRDVLIQSLREEASRTRLREEEKSVRQFVLEALKEIDRPQKAGFLNEYVWASEQVSLDTRGFGALRRDERKAWERHRSRRQAGDRRPPRGAYIVPALDEQGRPHPRWVARSDWPAERRVVLQPDDRLVELTKLRALIRARQERRPDMPYDPLGSLIEKHAGQLLEVFDAPPITDVSSREAWLESVGDRVEKEIKKAERSTQRKRRAAAELIEALPEESQLWGAPD